jgi:S-adenosylmethionine hydrolase
VLGRAPEARLVDLVHATESGSLYAAAYLLTAAHPYFPPGTVRLVLKDPSSARARRTIAAAVDGTIRRGPRQRRREPAVG